MSHAFPPLRSSDLGRPVFALYQAEAGGPGFVTAPTTSIQDADALLMATPEYNYSIAPALKNAPDWASLPYGQSLLEGKPVELMGAGAGLGTVRAQLHLRDVAITTNMPVLNRPAVFVTNAATEFVPDWRLLNDHTSKIIPQI